MSENSTEEFLASYLLNRTGPSNWTFLLQALAAELSEGLRQADRRELMRRIGARAAESMLLPQSESTLEVQAAFNSHWQPLDWGFVLLHEDERYLVVTHYGAPLVAGFGADALDWTAGFLEGVYQQWFSMLGADDSLHVTRAPEQEAVGRLVFRLGR